MMMKKQILFVSLLMIIGLSSQAQRDETLFGRLDLTGAWFTSTYNFSFFEEDTEFFSGGSFDLEFGKDLYLGWSWHRMRDDARISSESNEFYRLRHNGLNVAFAPKSGRVVHPRLGFYVGSGKIEENDNRKDRVWGITPSAGIEINVTSWFRLGAEGGYRYIADVDFAGVNSEDFSTPFAQLQLRFGFSWDY